jgi:5'-3' exonuclease
MSKQLHELTPLLDCDIMLYRCGFAADSQVKKDIEASGVSDKDEINEILQATDYTNFALGNVKTVMEDLLSAFDAHGDGAYKAFLSGRGNFREQVATLLPYKGNRDELHKPKYYADIKRYLSEVYRAVSIDGREADDALGCEQWACKDRSTCIVTVDKDLDMIPGYHYNWVKKEFYDQDLDTANRFLFYQMLTGDRTDNIPGIKGIGDVRAGKLLRSLGLESARAVVQEEYQKQYGEHWQQAYNEVATLLWIQRVEGKECPYL